MILENSHKYKISAMCKILGVCRSSIYYKPKAKIVDVNLENAVIEEWCRSKRNYGTRKLKVVLNRRGMVASRRKIAKIMAKHNLVSNYTLRHKKRKKITVNEANLPNTLNRDFNKKHKYEAIVSDLTYIKIAGKWRYLCLLIDLCGRKILGIAVGNHRNSKLVKSNKLQIEDLMP